MPPLPMAGMASVFSPVYNQHFYKGHVRRPNKDHIIDLKAREHAHKSHMFKMVTPPASWDSRTKNWIGPIKNQKQCGSCWDFSGTCVVEVAYYKAGIFPNDGSCALSEEYTLSCGRNGGCGGDDNTTVLDWAKSTGLPKTSDYGSYTASAGRCNWKQGMPLYKVNNWGFASSSNQQGIGTDQEIKVAIMTYGCVGSGVAADDSFSNYSGGVFSKNTSDSIDHDIVLCGWDDSKGQNGKTAWLLRNSWDTSWGESGYMWILSGINQVGSEPVWAEVNPVAPPIWYP